MYAEFFFTKKTKQKTKNKIKKKTKKKANKQNKKPNNQRKEYTNLNILHIFNIRSA